jgi:uncharacterized protein
MVGRCLVQVIILLPYILKYFLRDGSMMRIVEGLLVKHTGPKGFGIFSMRSYAKGEVVAIATGPTIKDTDKRLTHRAVQIGSRRFIEPRRFSSIWFLNHSCEPNAYMDMDKLIARRAVAKGEELTADYSLFTDFRSWEMECGCKRKSCRKIILPYCRLTKQPKRFVSSYLSGARS